MIEHIYESATTGLSCRLSKQHCLKRGRGTQTAILCS